MPAPSSNCGSYIAAESVSAASILAVVLVAAPHGPVARAQNAAPVRPLFASGYPHASRPGSPIPRAVNCLGLLSVARSGYDGVSSTIARNRAGSRPVACANTRWLW